MATKTKGSGYLDYSRQNKPNLNLCTEQRHDLNHFLQAYAGHSLMYRLLSKECGRPLPFLMRNLAYIRSGSQTASDHAIPSTRRSSNCSAIPSPGIMSSNAINPRRNSVAVHSSIRSRRSSSILNVSNSLLKQKMTSKRDSDLQNHNFTNRTLATATLPELKFQTTTAHKIIVRFKYGPRNVLCQMQEITDARCPWCKEACRTIFGLLKHLSLCHYHFSYEFAKSCAGDSYIDVYPLESLAYACRSDRQDRSGIQTSLGRSYSSEPIYEEMEAYRSVQIGNKQVDSLSNQQDISGQEVHVIHSTISKTFMFVGYRAPYFFSFQEFSIGPCRVSAGEFAVRKARLANSQRKYYASQFCVQKDPDSCNDSDDEADDESWLKLESDLLLDEFNDVNGGEKSFMKLWNSFLRKNMVPKAPLVHHDVRFCDRRFPSLVLDFVRDYQAILRRGRLINNLKIHLALLVSYGIITRADVVAALQILDNLIQLPDVKFEP
eukprot:gene3784-6306_t